MARWRALWCVAMAFLCEGRGALEFYWRSFLPWSQEGQRGRQPWAVARTAAGQRGQGWARPDVHAYRDAERSSVDSHDALACVLVSGGPQPREAWPRAAQRAWGRGRARCDVAFR
jgi:hypothetical protein